MVEAMGVAVCYDMQFSDVCMEGKKKGADFMAVPYDIPIEGPRNPSELIDGNGLVTAAAGCTEAELLTGEF